MKKIIFILIIILLIASGIFYWALFLRTPATPDEGAAEQNPSIFNPFNRSQVPATGTSTGQANPIPSSITSTPSVTSENALPRLRQLSALPIGGFMASTTASTTLVQYIDRGMGHIYEATGLSLQARKISNTTIPRVYESFWNRKGDLAVIRYMKDDESIVHFSAELQRTPATASSTEIIPYEIKGKFLSPTLREIAVSPKGDRIFTFNSEDEKGIGYVSGFDESKKSKVIETPLTFVNAEWPEENTVALTTRASGSSTGQLYFIDLKKPYLKRIVGGVIGLASTVSPDAKRVLFSSATPRGLTTYIQNVQENTTQEVIFRTAAEKCVWSKLHPTEAYCAVPTELPVAAYPDDWYKGNVSFVDQIWHLDSVTGEVQLIANLLNLSNSLIDVINPALDPKENFLYFMNKKDLTLWSLDLNE